MKVCMSCGDILVSQLSQVREVCSNCTGNIARGIFARESNYEYDHYENLDLRRSIISRRG